MTLGSEGAVHNQEFTSLGSLLVLAGWLLLVILWWLGRHVGVAFVFFVFGLGCCVASLLILWEKGRAVWCDGALYLQSERF